MPILTIIITFVIVGLLMWLVNTYIPMEAGIKKLLNIAIIICLVLWLLNIFGIFSNLGSLGTVGTRVR